MRQPRRRLGAPPGALLLAATIGTATAVISAPSASAEDRPNFELPFACHTDWRGNTYPDHSPSWRAIDFNQGSGYDDYGEPLYASASGRVVRELDATSAYGNFLEIGVAQGDWTAAYAHLKDKAVHGGDVVEQGQLIGHLGDTDGNDAAASHLHYEQRHYGGVVEARFHGTAFDYDAAFTSAGSIVKSQNCGNAAVNDSSVSAVVGETGRAVVFARSRDDQLQFKRKLDVGDGWGAWQDLGGSLAEGPDAASRKPGYFTVAYRTTTGAVAVRSRTPDNGWGPANVISDAFDTPYAPAIAATDPDTLKVFAVRKADHKLRVRTWKTGTGWDTWNDLPGDGFTSAPDATLRDGGKLDLVVRGPAGGLQRRILTPGSGWSDWETFGAPDTGPGLVPGAAPGTASRNPGQLDVTARNTNGELWRRTWNAGAGWTPWAHLDFGIDATAGPDLLADPNGSGDLQIFLRDGDGQVRTSQWNAGTGWGPLSLLN